MYHKTLFIVFWERWENQFDGPKKDRQLFRNVFENLPPASRKSQIRFCMPFLRNLEHFRQKCFYTQNAKLSFFKILYFAILKGERIVLYCRDHLKINHNAQRLQLKNEKEFDVYRYPRPEFFNHPLSFPLHYNSHGKVLR